MLLDARASFLDVFVLKAGDTMTGGLVVQSADGLDLGSGVDEDQDLITVAVTGSPKLQWNETLDRFSFDKPVQVVAAVTYAGVISSSNPTWAGFQQQATSSGAKPYIELYNQADSEVAWIELDPTNQRLQFSYDGYWLILEKGGDVGVGGTAPTAQLHVDQASTTGAQPVLLLDQADVDQAMIQFETTIGEGNAVEAVGAKSLTTTHFIMVTLPGGLTRYIPAGTIA
jgi:hypothetical protein